eukprot:CAMPEP_0174946552 /NCGR_PEP_ID=MMETSP1355-20121228/84388_1 /TAXON_ID=464990 /ORGANISM="Hemiselmis tepida, Strain CCMP443" /LENGTH=259 /DNA_ID=CAMNT_0016193983 /DNA_START=95 /DNA_END=871 /DNA_ORIENTATION=-
MEPLRIPSEEEEGQYDHHKTLARVASILKDPAESSRPLSLSLKGNPVDANRSRAGDELVTKLLTLLSENPNNLTSLDLSNTGMLGAAHAKVNQLLAQTSTLKTLHLAGNRVSGSTLQGLISALEANTSLRELDLAANRIKNSSILKGQWPGGQILGSNTTVTSLNLSWNGIPGDFGSLGALAANRSLVDLDLKGNVLFGTGEAFAKVLGENTCLQSLDLSYNQIGITDEGIGELFGALHGNTTLTYLGFSGAFAAPPAP